MLIRPIQLPAFGLANPDLPPINKIKVATQALLLEYPIHRWWLSAIKTKLRDNFPSKHSFGSRLKLKS